MTPGFPLPQQPQAVADAAEALVYAIIGLFLVLGEYLISLIIPQTGPLAVPGFVAEMALSIYGIVFGVLAVIAGLQGMRDPTARQTVGTMGWVGLALGLGAIAGGAVDVYYLATHIPDSGP